MTSLPLLICEFGFTTGGASTSTYLHLSDTTRGLLGTGTLAPGGVMTDTSTYVRSVSTRRGASRVEGPVLRYEAGTATITLRNEDRRFDPTYLDGPYVSAGASQVTPMRTVRIRATWAGTTYEVWRGYVDSWQISYDGPNYSEATAQCTDGFKVLSNYDRPAVAAVGAGDDTGARVDRILDSIVDSNGDRVWSSTDRVISTGDTTLQATDLSGDALSELFLAADTEIGELYMDAANRVVFRNRNAILTDTRSNTPQGTFGDGGGSELPYVDLQPAYDDTTLANLVRITRVGGAQQTASDATSQSAYLVRTFNRDDLIMQDDATAASYAGFILAVAKDPEYLFTEITINPPGDPSDLFPQALGREIGDLIEVIRRPPGGGDAITRDAFVRGVAHEVTADTWLTTWELQSATKYSFLVLGHPTLGVLGSNALAY